MEKLYEYITHLVNYAEREALLDAADRTYAVNGLLGVFGVDEYEEPASLPATPALEEILAVLCDIAYERGILAENGVAYRDLFDTRVMGVLTPPPSVVRAAFGTLLAQDPERATDYFYRLCLSSDYIRTYRVSKDMKWKVPSQYGEIDITVNLSKPEKDPKAIAAARSMPQSGYPKCLLCHENEGYAGTLRSPARQNLRQIPFTLGEETWYMQYSPYVYYNEHCILLSSLHTPMRITKNTFVRALDFVDALPHYFVGSNADLPIVGGSILTHDHMQGGRYTFAMARAEIETPLSFRGFEDVTAGIVRWPMSVIRLSGKDKARLVALADKILTAWRGYTDEDAFVFAETDGEKHNTVTPIARRRGECFELDLVLRNNITTKEHPMGVYHPHAELHHIKKENIGLIEVMGLAVLPARLKDELSALSAALARGADVRADEALAKHADWTDSLASRYRFAEMDEAQILDVLKREVGAVFVRVLEDAGVYKCTEEGRAAFRRFADAVNAI